MEYRALWIWGIVALVALGLFAFGILSLSTNLFVAVGIGLIVVGVAKLFQVGSNPAIGIALMGAGGVLWLFDGFTTLTIGDAAALAASFVGGGA